MSLFGDLNASVVPPMSLARGLSVIQEFSQP